VRSPQNKSYQVFKDIQSSDWTRRFVTRIIHHDPSWFASQNNSRKR
ncbi:6520_t:CDS:1, partial [Gigaspora margarita]